MADDEDKKQPLDEEEKTPPEDEEKKKPWTKKRKPRSRLIVRLGLFLIGHSTLVSVVCSVAGFIALLLLPALAKNTYISENALMPGSANPMFSSQDVADANEFAKDIMESVNKKEGTGIEVQNLIQKRVADVGAEFYYHNFRRYSNHFHPLQFFSSIPNNVKMQDNVSCMSFGLNSVGIIRAPRGDGKEAIVFVTPYNSQDIEPSDALSLGLAFSIFSLLSRVTWLAKDIVWLAADSRFGEYTAVDAWLKDYYNPFSQGNLDKSDISWCHDVVFKGSKSNTFRRAGTMTAALVFKVIEKKEKDYKDTLTLYAEASNGQMPNLDLVNIVHYLAVHRQGLHVKIGTVVSLLNSVWLNYVGELLESCSRMIKTFNPNWKFDIRSSDYVEGTATLASSIYSQALGVPTGSHGAFRDYQVDAISLELSPRFSLNNKNSQSAFLLRAGRLIEGVTRSVNNLLEKFHQSFFLYFLTSPNKFVSVGIYMIPFALLVAPLPIVAAALFSGNDKKETSDKLSQTIESAVSEEAGILTVSWKWLQALKVVFAIHLWAVTIAVLPHFISQLSSMSPSTCMITWILLGSFVLLTFYLVLGSYSLDCDWRLVKSVMIAAVSIGLSLMSIVNFSVAQIGAMLLVPLCLLIQPVRQMQVALFLRPILVAFNLALIVFGFPPTALLITNGLSDGFGKVCVGDFWELAELLWSWNSASYLYLLVVHLPCWVLCVHVLLHPCSSRCSKA